MKRSIKRHEEPERDFVFCGTVFMQKSTLRLQKLTWVLKCIVRDDI